MGVNDVLPLRLMEYAYSVASRAVARVAGLLGAGYSCVDLPERITKLVVTLSHKSLETRNIDSNKRLIAAQDAVESVAAPHLAEAVMNLMLIKDDVREDLLPIMLTLFRRGEQRDTRADRRELGRTRQIRC